MLDVRICVASGVIAINSITIVVCSFSKVVLMK
jgi:hypothetical protein